MWLFICTKHGGKERTENENSDGTNRKKIIHSGLKFNHSNTIDPWTWVWQAWIHLYADFLPYSTINVFPILYDFLNNVFFSPAYFIHICIYVLYIKCITYVLKQNMC